MSDKTEKSGNKFIKILLVLVPIVIILGGLGFYYLVYIPSKVNESLNKNIDTHNALLQKTQDTLNDLNTNFNKLSDVSSTDYQDNVKNITGLTKQKTNSISSDIDSSLKLIDNGLNSDTKEFADLIKQNISGTKDVVSSLKSSLDYYLCFATKNKSVYDTNTDLGAVSATFSPQKSKDEFLASSKKMQDDFKQFKNIATDYGSCFTGKFAKYKDKEFDDAVAEIIAYFDGYSQSYQLLDQYVQTQDTTFLNSANNKIATLKTQNPKFMDDSFNKKLLDYGRQDLDNDLKTLSDYREIANVKLDSISKKYKFVTK